MGELSAQELARDLSDEWYQLDDDIPIYSYMGLSPREYARWITAKELPHDFEKRHQDA